MEKNYNYNYENRSQGQKLPVNYSNLGLSSCTSKELKKQPVSNGSLWHTTDTNEFYYDWNGKRTKLNLTGDSASISAELAKIKADMKNLNPDAVQQKINQLTTKVDNAVSTVNGLKSEVQDAVNSANAASQAAEEAAAAVAGKANMTDVQDAIDAAVADKADKSDLNNKADAADVEALDAKVDGFQTAIDAKPDMTDVESAITSAIADKADKSDLDGKANAADLEELDAKVDGFQTSIDAKPDMTAVESAIASAIANKADKSDLDSKADAADVEALETELGNKADKTDLNGKANVADVEALQTELGNKADKSDLAGKASKDEFDALKDVVEAIEIPTKVSAFENDAKYITLSDLDEYVTSSELENLGSLTPEDREKIDSIPANFNDFVRDDELAEALSEFATQSDLTMYVKTADVVEYIEQNSDFVKRDEIKDFLEASDIEDFITLKDLEDVLEDKVYDEFVSQSDLELYVSKKDLDEFVDEFVTSSELDNRLAGIELQIPENVGAFTNDVGYITRLDIADDLLSPEDKAALEAIKDLGPSDVETGTFPVVDPDAATDPTDAASNGLATVQDVMDYVNALFEKKKDELGPGEESKDYFYANGVEFTGTTPTLTPIYQMNCFEITDAVNTDAGMIIEIATDTEKYGLDGEGDDTIDSYSQVFGIDIPDGYNVTVYSRDVLNPSGYSNATTELIANPRGATKQYGSRTYNSYIRDVNGDYYENVIGSQTRYKLIIKK